MSEQTCCVLSCGIPVDDASLCLRCTDALERTLAEVPWLTEQLQITVTRDKAKAITPGGRIAEKPLPFHVKASEVATELHAELVRLVRLLGGSADPSVSDTPESLSRWLLCRMEDVRRADYGDAVEALCSIYATAYYVIDIPEDRWYAGTCSAPMGDGGHCDCDLYARSDKGVITCAKCGEHHDVGRRREILLEHARDHLATASEAARAVVVWSDYDRGETRLVKRIGMWASRKRIAVRGHMAERGQLRPTYRIGDILELLTEEAHREAEKAGA